MPPLMAVLAAAVLLALAALADRAFARARQAEQRTRMNHHAMQRFLADLAQPSPFKDWRDTPDPYGLEDVEVTPPSRIVEVRYVKLPLHQFRLEGTDLTPSNAADALYVLSNVPSEHIDA